MIRKPPADAIEYPDSDGRPMADNTKQYEWIVALKAFLDLLFRGDPNVFVAGDHLIYAVKGDPKKRRAPDVYVAFGRPKGHRGSYKVWEEGNVFPQVIFEVLSPKNRVVEMRKKKAFYLRFGAEEYYVIDPDLAAPEVWLRRGKRFVAKQANGFVSPRLGIRFDTTGEELAVYGPDGERMEWLMEVSARAAEADAAKRQAATAQRRADTQKRRADIQQQRADAEAAVRAKLAAKLRELGIDPDAV